MFWKKIFNSYFHLNSVSKTKFSILLDDNWRDLLGEWEISKSMSYSVIILFITEKSYSLFFQAILKLHIYKYKKIPLIAGFLSFSFIYPYLTLQLYASIKNLLFIANNPIQIKVSLIIRRNSFLCKKIQEASF